MSAAAVPPPDDRSTILNWLSALYDQCDTGWLTLFSIDRSTGDRYVDWSPIDDYDLITDAAINRTQTGCVWFGVATRGRRLPAGRGGAGDCAHIPGLWLDIDITGPGHQTPHPLPADTTAARALIARFPLQPTYVVHSGGGLQAWWLFPEPLDTTNALPLLTRWGATWTQISEDAGLHIDNVFDIARVMRLPGTTNHKTDPQPVLVIEQTDVRYDPSDIDDHLTDPPAPPERPTAAASVPYIGPERPGDAFNAIRTGIDVLTKAGWELHRKDANGDEHWTRPGKDPRQGGSATVYADDGHTTIWTDAIPGLQTRRPYDPFGLYTVLFHEGDFTAASDQLEQDGYGTKTRPDDLSWLSVTDRSNGNGTDPPDSSGLMQVNNRPLAEISREAIDQLTAHNDPPELFVRAGVLTRVRTDENGRPIVEPLGAYQLRNRLSIIINTIRVNKDGAITHVPPPLDVINDILAAPHWPFPPLEAITELPTIRPDGTIHDHPGYDPATRRLYIPNCIKIPPITDNPTPNEIAGARALLDDLLADFPFDTDSDHTNAIGLLLTPLVRPAINGQIPLALIDAPEPGTGKGLLANIASVIATGRPAAARPLARVDDEVRKMLTAVLVEGPTLVVLDNIDDAIRSPSLAAVLTTDEWTDRLLGRSETIAVPNRCTWVATGNNLAVAGDIGRRCYRIRLDAHQARPYTRTGFRHPDLLGWAQQNRAELVAALLTIARAWWANGKPAAPDPSTIGGFTPWAHTIAGILHNAGIDGFLTNLQQLHATLDVETEAWETFLTALHETFDNRRVAAADIAREIESEYTNLRYVVPADLTDSIGRPRFARALGDAFRRREGRRHGDSEIAVFKAGQSRNKTVLWSVVPIRTPAGEENDFTSAGSRGPAGSLSTNREDVRDEVF